MALLPGNTGISGSPKTTCEAEGLSRHGRYTGRTCTIQDLKQHSESSPVSSMMWSVQWCALRFGFERHLGESFARKNSVQRSTTFDILAPSISSHHVLYMPHEIHTFLGPSLKLMPSSTQPPSEPRLQQILPNNLFPPLLQLIHPPIRRDPSSPQKLRPGCRQIQDCPRRQGRRIHRPGVPRRNLVRSAQCRVDESRMEREGADIRVFEMQRLNQPIRRKLAGAVGCLCREHD